MTMTRSEWLARRRQHIGGSDAAAVLGRSQWRTPLEVCQDKRGELEDAPTRYMERGLVLEPLLIHIYEHLTDRKIEPSEWMVSEEHPVMAATPDGFDLELDALVQCKTANMYRRKDFGEPGAQDIPDDYFLQCQHEMAVTGAETDVLAVLFAEESVFDGLRYMVEAGMNLQKAAGFVFDLIREKPAACEFAPYPITRDNDLIAMMIEQEETWWQRYIVERNDPPDASIPEKTSKYVAADAQSEQWMRICRDAQTEEKAQKAVYDEHRKYLENVIGDHSGISHPDLGKINWKAPKPKDKTDWEAVAKDLAFDSETLAAAAEKRTASVQGKRSFRPYWKKQK